MPFNMLPTIILILTENVSWFSILISVYLTNYGSNKYLLFKNNLFIIGLHDLYFVL